MKLITLIIALLCSINNGYGQMDSLLVLNRDVTMSYSQSAVKRGEKTTEIKVKLYFNNDAKLYMFSLNNFELMYTGELISENPADSAFHVYILQQTNLDYSKFDKKSTFYSLPNQELITINYFVNNKENAVSINLKQLKNVQ